MPIDITDATGELGLRGTYLFSQFPAPPRDPTRDQFFILPDGLLTLTGTGDWLNRRWNATPGTLALSGTGTIRLAVLLSTAATGTLVLSGAPTVFLTQGIPIEQTVGSNWVKWSKVGSLDFTIDRSNVAGQMPLPMNGPVWAILQRGTTILVYGRNAVFALLPSSNVFGHRRILDVGLKSKQAVIDTGDAHFFVDSLARLWKFADGPQLLDYREWLSGLASPVLSFNPSTRLLYICDGTLGYVYNTDTGSMGKGPATVTGVDAWAGTVYVVASGAMTIPDFAITTDMTDFGTRKMKSIQSLEVGVDSPLTLQAAIEYRHNKAAAFLTTSWYTIDSRGQVFIACMGSEFRFKVKATSAGVFHVDSLLVNGVVHAH